MALFNTQDNSTSEINIYQESETKDKIYLKSQIDCIEKRKIRIKKKEADFQERIATIKDTILSFEKEVSCKKTELEACKEVLDIHREDIIKDEEEREELIKKIQMEQTFTRNFQHHVCPNLNPETLEDCRKATSKGPVSKRVFPVFNNSRMIKEGFYSFFEPITHLDYKVSLIDEHIELLKNYIQKREQKIQIIYKQIQYHKEHIDYWNREIIELERLADALLVEQENLDQEILEKERELDNIV